MFAPIDPNILKYRKQLKKQAPMQTGGVKPMPVPTKSAPVKQDPSRLFTPVKQASTKRKLY